MKTAPQKRSRLRRFAESAVIAVAGAAAIAIPLHLLLRRELRDAPEDLNHQGWPIRLLHVLFARYILRWVDVKGLENLPSGSYVVVANHGYRSGVDGFILGHLLATRAGRVPRILVTADTRNWMVRAERWVLHHYGIALLVPAAGHRGLSDVIARYLKESAKHAVLIFPAGRAIADPAMQLKKWSTGAVVAAEKSGCPIVPIAIGGLRLDWSPETVIFAALEADSLRPGDEPPFGIHVRIGKPIQPTIDSHADLERVRAAVAELMEQIPGLRPAPGESDPAFGKITLNDGRTLAYTDRGPRTGTPILYFHGFQGSRLERLPGLDSILEKLNIRLIAPDRPGIGLSTPARGRTLSDWAGDVRQLTEQVLTPERDFSILGFSAGATYALACGLLPGVNAIALTGGLGLPHLITEWRRYSSEVWRILLSARLASLRSSTFLRLEKKQRNRLMNEWGRYFEDVKHDLSKDDQRLLAQTEVEELFQADRREGYAQGSGCLLQEVQAFYSDPDVVLTRLAACSVLIVHGAEDTVVPVNVAWDLHRKIPSSRFTELPGRGHYFLYDPEETEKLLAELLDLHKLCSADKKRMPTA